jgi:anti-sigma factor RsiW
MTEQSCLYSDQREEMLVAYLYDDVDPGERSAFQSHLLTCVRCRDEVAALRSVRTRLSRWAPPEPSFTIAGRRSGADLRDERSRHADARLWARLAGIPVWTQVAAAMLCVGVSAGVANLDVRYGATGLSVRTGWSKPAPTAEVAPAVTAPWRDDVAALEQQLRTEFRAEQASFAARTAAAQAPRVAAPVSDAEIVRRVNALIEESERRQQRELALRVADLMRELDTQRRADLVKIDRSLGVLQNNTGVEVMKQRELLNYLVRVSQKQ